MTMHSCPCGTDKIYSECCGVFISGKLNPATPEELMRSRYTAYSQANIDYIAATMKGPAALNFDRVDANQWAHDVNWLALEVVNASHNDSIGHVEFLAHYAHGGQRFVLHEISEFRFEDGRWYYVDGKAPEKISSKKTAPVVSRNALCSCGSNKKYKKCCGKPNP